MNKSIRVSKNSIIFQSVFVITRFVGDKNRLQNLLTQKNEGICDQKFKVFKIPQDAFRETSISVITIKLYSLNLLPMCWVECLIAIRNKSVTNGFRRFRFNYFEIT